MSEAQVSLVADVIQVPSLIAALGPQPGVSQQCLRQAWFVTPCLGASSLPVPCRLQARVVLWARGSRPVLGLS